MSQQNKGVMLMAFGSNAYTMQASNLAASIKAIHPDLPITLFSDGSHKILGPYYRSFFNDIKEIPSEYLYPGFDLDAGFAKTWIAELAPYDLTLYLDTDSIIFQSLDAVFNALESETDHLAIPITSIAPKGGKTRYFTWVTDETYYKDFGLDESKPKYAVQSSFMLLRKGDKSKAFFDEVREVMQAAKTESLLYKWGKGIPDELAFNIALSKRHPNLDGVVEAPMLLLFPTKENNHMYFKEIKEAGYAGFTLYGAGIEGNTVAPIHLYEIYDRILNQIHRKQNRQNHIFKYPLAFANQYAG